MSHHIIRLTRGILPRMSAPPAAHFLPTCTCSRSFHSSLPLFALPRSSSKSSKTDDPVAIAQQDSLKKKLTPEKVASLLHYPELQVDQALKIFNAAVRSKVADNAVCETMLDYLKDKKRPDLVERVWSVVTENKLPFTIGMLEVVHDMYRDSEDAEKMMEIAEKMDTLKPPSPKLYNAVVDLYMKRGQTDQAFALVEKLKEKGAKPDSMTYGQILKYLLEQKNSALAIETYKKMRTEGVRPSGVTVYLMIEAYGQAGMYDKAVEMFDIGKGMALRLNIHPYISAMKYLGKSGNVKRAAETFDLMLTDRQPQGPVSYQTLMEVYATNNMIPDAIKTLEKMKKEGYKPTLAAFLILLDVLLPGNDVATLSSVVELMKACKVDPDDSLQKRFKEFETRNKVKPFWPS